MRMWNRNGTVVHKYENGAKPTVWNEYLCFGAKNDIIVWKEWNDCVNTFKGHSNSVNSLAPAGEYLFSGSYDKTIRKWNEQGECLLVVNQHTAKVTCVLVHNGKLCNAQLTRQ